MDNSKDTIHSALAELDHLVEAALSELADDERLDHPPGLSDGAARPDPTVVEILDAAARLREVTEVERLEAPALADRLEGRPEAQARLLIDNQTHCQTWGLCEELVARSRRATFSGVPGRAVRIARLATMVSERLDDDLYSGGLADDMRARTWGALANAYRVSGEFEASEAAFRQAEDLLEEGSGDPLEQAGLLSLRASLEHTLGDFGAALAILERAEAIYSELDEDELLAKVLVQKANAAGFVDPPRGVRYARAAERLIDPEVDERLFLLARHTQILWMVDAGEPERARMLMDASRSLYRRHQDPWLHVKRAGAEAHMLFALGQIEEAEAAFQVVLEEESAQGRSLEMVIAALELAACRLALGDPTGAAEIASAMATHLRECGAHNHAREAWAFFRQALSLQRASDDLVHEVRTYLRLAWNNPDLRFRSTG